MESMADLVKSLGGDFKWMKDAEIEEMAGIAAKELAFVYSKLEEQETPEEES
jgi:hypothetical protein